MKKVIGIIVIILMIPVIISIIGDIDGEFDNTVLAFFWIIPVLLVGGLIYLLLKRKE